MENRQVYTRNKVYNANTKKFIIRERGPRSSFLEAVSKVSQCRENNFSTPRFFISNFLTKSKRYRERIKMKETSFEITNEKVII